MRNYVLDWNNNNVVIVKKGYLNNVQKGKGWEALEAQKLIADGWTLKNGTMYSVTAAVKSCATNSYFSRALATV